LQPGTSFRVLVLVTAVLLEVGWAGGQSTDAALNRGKAALNDKQWDIAAAQLLKSQTASPSAMKCYLLAVAYAHLGDIAQTRSYAFTALNSNPPLIEPYRAGAVSLLSWSKTIEEEQRNWTFDPAMSVHDNHRNPDLLSETASSEQEKEENALTSKSEVTKTRLALQFLNPCANPLSQNPRNCLAQLLSSSPNYPAAPDVQLPAPDIEGTVSVQAGNVPDATQIWFSDTDPPTLVGNDGSFFVPNGSDVLFVVAKSYAPAAKVIEPGSSRVEITLERESPRNGVAECGRTFTKTKVLRDKTGNLRYSVPRDLRVNRQQKREETDYELVDVSLNASITIAMHPAISASHPPRNWILSSASYSGRVWNCPGLSGVDFSGILTSGLRWRWMGNKASVISYYGVSDPAAARLDIVTDEVCCD
jgi:hypothetical protein